MFKILFYYALILFSFFFFLFFELYFLKPAVIAQMFNPFAKLVITVRIPIKEVKAETEIHPVIVEAKARSQLNLEF